MGGYGTSVLMPLDNKGLHPDEITISKLLQQTGYATTCIGKWHLGDQGPFLPTRHGFDSYFGIPYGDDMMPRLENPTPLIRDEEVIEADVDRNLLTRRYTEAAVEFIRQHRDQPFFLYLAHSMPGRASLPTARTATVLRRWTGQPARFLPSSKRVGSLSERWC